MKEEKKLKLIDSGIDIQSFVVKKEKDKWLNLLNYYQKYKSTSPISPMQKSILEKVATDKTFFPSEKQSKILYDLYIRAKNEGIENI